MKQEYARGEAKALLHKLIENQPELIVPKNVNIEANGILAAKFCAQFIDTYAEYLMKSEPAQR